MRGEKTEGKAATVEHGVGESVEKTASANRKANLHFVLETLSENPA